MVRDWFDLVLFRNYKIEGNDEFDQWWKMRRDLENEQLKVIENVDGRELCDE